ncbi:unnamed protein product [Calicophoron daubneyi]|uniref:U1-type domain-containing protein n=1 Tax=Calicophoron daubneyi TaxID=300641 RepID=A0AAV2SWT3_CALDB
MIGGGESEDATANGQEQSQYCLSEWIKSKIEDEGIQARNIIKYSVPVDDVNVRCHCPKHPRGSPQIQVDVAYSSEPSQSHWSRPSSRNSVQTTSASIASAKSKDRNTSMTNASSTTSSTNSAQLRRRRLVHPSTKFGSLARLKTGTRPRLAEGEYRARYWGQMLDTLRRTIDEIYSACETDESEVECKEVIMILEHSKQDFHSLIEKMNLLRDFEQADEQNRPNSIAWDERTTWPGKPIMCQVLASAAVDERHRQGPYLTVPLNLAPGYRVLDFGDNESEQGSTTGSWHLILPTCISDTEPHHRSSQFVRIASDAVTPTNLGASAVFVPSSRQPTKSDLLSESKSSVQSASDMTNSGFLSPNHPDRNTEHSLDFDAGETDAPDAEDEGGDDEEEEDEVGFSPLILKQSANVEVPGIHDVIPAHHQYGDEEALGITDDDDNTLSRDLRQIDEAIASMTTAERVLTDQLDRARRLIAVETAATAKKPDGLESMQEQLGRRKQYREDFLVGKLDQKVNTNPCRVQLKRKTELSKPIGISKPEKDVELLELDDISPMGGSRAGLDDRDKAFQPSEQSAVRDSSSQFTKAPLKQLIDKVCSGPVTAVRPLNTGMLPTMSTTTPSLSAPAADSTPASSGRHYRKCCSCDCHEPVEDRNNYADRKRIPCMASAVSRPKKVPGGRTCLQNMAGEPLRQDSSARFSKKDGPTICYVPATHSESSIHKEITTCRATDGTGVQSFPDSTLPNPPIDQKFYLKTIDVPSSGTNKLVDTQEGIVQLDKTDITKGQNKMRPEESSEAEPNSSHSVMVAAAPTSPEKGEELAPEAVADRQIALISSPAVSMANASLLFITESGAKSRTPGHGIQMHEKLSARSRRRTTNSILELEQKQTKARILRQQHLFERAERVHELSKKVEEVHLQKRLLLHQRRSCLERRLHAAERKRKAELERRVLKAHDEETKAREIAFIQTLEAEQKQHNILTKHEESRARLDELAAERRRRLEEKLCREEAAKGRRRALEASRRARLDALQARWESRAQQLASRAELLEHSRRAAARAKERHREVKIANLEEQQRTHIEQLRTKIQRKQAESERRHQESLREISRKAFEMSVLTHTADESVVVTGLEPYPIQKWCCACKVMITSEVSLKSHLHGKRHQNAVLEAAQNRPVDRSDLEAFNLLHLVDAPPDLLDPKAKAEQDRLKLRRKRARKLRQRMNQRGLQYTQELEKTRFTLPDSANKAQLQKLVKDARRFVNLPDSGPWVTTRIQAMEKALNSLIRLLTNSRSAHEDKIRAAGDAVYGFDNADIAVPDHLICTVIGLPSVLTNLLGLIRDQRPSSTQLVPDRTYQLACELLSIICSSCSDACRRMVFSNDISVIIDCLVARLSTPLPGNRIPGSIALFDHSEASESVNIPSSNPCIVVLLDCLATILTRLVHLCSPSADNVRLTVSDTRSTSKYSTVDSQRVQDLLSYIVSSGLVELLASRLSSPRQANLLLRSSSGGRGGTSSNSSHAVINAQQFVLSSIAFLTSLIRLLSCVPATQAKQQQQLHSTSRSQSSEIRPQPKLHTERPRGNCPLDKLEEEKHASTTSVCNRTEHESPSPGLVARDDKVSADLRCGSTSSHDTQLASSVSSSRNQADSLNTTFNGSPPASHLVGVDDPTKLLEMIMSTEVFGLIPLLYSLLLDPSSTTSRSSYPNPANAKEGRSNLTPRDSHQTGQIKKTVPKKSNKNEDRTSPTRGQPLPFRSTAVGQITLEGLILINSLAMVNQSALQSLLSGELTCLLIRHILQTLLARCASTSSGTPNFSGVFGVGSLDSKVHEDTNACLSPKSAQIHVPSVNPKRDDLDEINELLPSGARQVTVKLMDVTKKRRSDRPNNVENQPDLRNNSSKRFGLPAWANDDTTPASDPAPTFNPPTERLEQPPPAEQLTEAVLHEAILCVGHLCALHPDNQTSLQAGPPPTLLQRLVALPFHYFSQRPLTDVLYPTLIACCYQHTSNLIVLEAELSPTLLANYIEERLLEKTMDALSDVEGKPATADVSPDRRFRFEYRFPFSEWNAAKDYFSR